MFADILPLQDPNVPDQCAQYVVPQFNIITGEETMPVYEPGQVIDGVRVDLCTADSRANAKPSTTHWLGTDSSARDTFARAVHGARVAMIAGVVTIAIGLVVGGTIGLIAGFYRGKTETFLMAIVDIMLAFPTLVLALAIVAVLGRGLFNACIAITVVAIPAFARITRANTLAYAEREFVTAARVMGAKNTRIMLREILPNVIFPVVAFALVAIAVAIVAEGSLAFLSLSVKDPQASWGQMILDGRGVIDEWPHVSLIPAGDHVRHRAVLQPARRPVPPDLQRPGRGAVTDTTDERLRATRGPPRRPCSTSSTSRRPRSPARGQRPQDLLPARGRHVRAVDGVSFTPRPGQDARRRRRVGLGQDRAVPLDHGPASSPATCSARAA